MLFSFLQKQKNKKHQKKLIESMILALNVDETQKTLYLESLEILSWEELDVVFSKLTFFVEKIEIREIEQIEKESFVSIAGMRKKEAEEKLEEVNGLSFLFHNL